ncbi:MAG TPA: hypothetical protein VHE30_08715, partial [Polyangiaceae bacterium]|nr:hypothetical protein [Polyangiaceae bacterium]
MARSYVSPYAIANGDPAQNHWLVEQGLAPWWTYDRLLLSFFRPVSALTHHVDYALFPDSPVLMHAHSLLWFFAVVYAATLVYRGVLGTTVAAGFAAFLYAVDHNHGLPVGWIANRNALPAIFFGLLSLRAYQAGRGGSRGAALAGPFLFLLGLLAGEVTLGALAYMVAYAFTLDEEKPASRATALAPYLVTVVVWRLVYNALGYGARGSGLYLDPVHEPVAFAAALVRRIPLLTLGQMGLPPAEAYYFVAEGLRPLVYGAAVLGTIVTVVVVWPLARADRVARFWTFGALLSLPLACTAYPHGRLLFFVGLGAMALVAILVRDAFARAAWLPLQPLWHVVAQPYLAATMGLHAFLSPFLLSLNVCSVATTSGIATRAVPDAMRAVTSPEDELFVLNAPEYFSVNLIPFFARLEHRTEPKRLRMLSIGPVPLEVHRKAPNVLDVHFVGGLLADPLSQLYRSARLPMNVGDTVKLEGFTVEVTAVTEDGRPERASFTFAEPLENPRYRFLSWAGETYARFTPPPIGGTVTLSAAHMPFEVG